MNLNNKGQKAYLRKQLSDSMKVKQKLILSPTSQVKEKEVRSKSIQNYFEVKKRLLDVLRVNEDELLPTLMTLKLKFQRSKRVS